MTTPRQRIEASKMLKILKREEAYYNKLLNHMQQDLQRLEVEELDLKAKLRQEEVKATEESSTTSKRKSVKDVEDSSDRVEFPSKQKKKINFSNGASSSSSVQGDENSLSSQLSLALNDSVVSSITDERYLEPLILNPSFSGHDSLVEFDD